MKLFNTEDRVEWIKSTADENAVILNPKELDNAIIGVSIYGQLVYSVESLVTEFMNIHDWDHETAVEWVNLNVLGFSTSGDLDPLYIWDMPEMENCEHDMTFYQPQEDDTNTPESLSCEDCGEDLPIPTEPDFN